MKSSKLSPDAVKLYEEASGFKTTGEVYVTLSDDSVFNLMEKIMMPVKEHKDDCPYLSGSVCSCLGKKTK